MSALWGSIGVTPAKKRTRKPRGGPNGRPATAKAKFDRASFETALKLQATKDMAAVALGMSRASLDRCIADEYPGETFETLADKHRTEVTLSLRQRVLRGAMAGDRTLLIFAAKAFAGLKERVEVAKDPEQHKDDLKAAKAVVTAEAARVDAVLAALNGGKA